METTLLSVVIPTYNRSNNLKLLLESLSHQEEVSFSWEIIVVDNASTDDTPDIVQNLIPLMPVPLRYVYESKPGLHQGRHKGVLEAKGEIVAFLDDDTVLPQEWISGAQLILSKQADAVVSRILPKWETQPPQWLLDLMDNGTYGLLTLLDLGDVPKEIDPGYVWGASFFIRRSIIIKLGGFNPDGMPEGFIHYRGDGESGLFRKFKATGYSAWYDPRSIAYHCVTSERMSVEYLKKRSFNQGISDSFAYIRKRAGFFGYTENRINSHSQNFLIPLILRIKQNIELKRMLVNIKVNLSHVYSFITGIPISKKNQITSAYWAGWNFHQTKIQDDPELSAYVNRDCYFDNYSNHGD
jgi:glucosyl-dolichyl phosphate glucuronosyltransferase